MKIEIIYKNTGGYKDGFITSIKYIFHGWKE